MVLSMLMIRMWHPCRRGSRRTAITRLRAFGSQGHDNAALPRELGGEIPYIKSDRSAPARAGAHKAKHERYSSSIRPVAEARRFGGKHRRNPASDHTPTLALYLAAQPSRPEAAGHEFHGAVAVGQARDHGDTFHLQMGNRCAD